MNRVPRLRRSAMLNLYPALPDRAHVWLPALRACFFRSRTHRPFIIPSAHPPVWITSSHTDSDVPGYFHAVPSGLLRAPVEISGLTADGPRRMLQVDKSDTYLVAASCLSRVRSRSRSSLERYCPSATTPAILRVLAMSSNGSASSKTRSAIPPFWMVP